MRHKKETGKCDPHVGKKSRHRNCLWESPDDRFNRQRLKNIHNKNLQRNLKTMLKDVKKAIMTMSHQIENINKEIEITFFKAVNWNSGFEKYNNKNENFTTGAKTIFKLVEERPSKYKDILIEIIQSEEKQKMNTTSEKCGTPLSTPI